MQEGCTVDRRARQMGYLEQLYAHILSRPGVLMSTGGQVYDWYALASGLRSRS
ncbi:MAG: hypothetical protein ACREJ5_10700 [Geminicoccaceae bacterium]